jgi:hypothetical protein
MTPIPFNRIRVLFSALILLLMATAARAADPGLIYPPLSELSDQKAGSVLFYNFYSSGATSGAAENSRFSVTNTSSTSVAFVHLFFVADNCSVSDLYVCLTPNQTATFLASDVDPGVRGYMMAVAVDVLGCPYSHNFLTGDVQVKLASGHEATLPAEAFAALYTGTLPGCDPNVVTTALNFNGFFYNRPPRMVAVDKLRSTADGNSAILVLNRFGGNLLTGASTLSGIAGVIYDDAATPFTFTFIGGCQSRNTLSDTFPAMTPVYSAVIPAGRTGWMKLYSVSDIGILGAVLNFNPNAAASGSAFIGGHNLRKMTLASTAVYTIPVFPPSCGS